MKKIACAIVVVGLALAIYYGTHARHARVRTLGSPMPPAPALTFTDLNGVRIDTSNYAGKVVLVNFWAAWCTPCAAEIPQLIALQNKYGPQGFQVIGISMEDTDSALRKFYRDYKINYPVIAGNTKIAEAYGGILGLPTTFLISRDGRVRAKYSGLLDFPKLEQEIAALLPDKS